MRKTMETENRREFSLSNNQNVYKLLMTSYEH